MKKVLLPVIIIVALAASLFLYENREASHFAKATRDKKILFVGDMMFDRYIRQVGYNKGEDYVFSCSGLSNFLKDSDLVVGNLEGPITGNPSISMGSEVGSSTNFVFTFPPSTAKFLSSNNIKLVNLGNNHIGNFGQKGIVSTKKYLSEAGVNYFYNNEIYRTNMGGNKISFISYNEFGGDNAEKIAQKIKEEKNNGQMVFVYAHWGDEYVEVPQRIKNIANLFAKSGADLIAGSHPHVILPSESFDFAQDRKTFVYYSLGNFIFDQYWNKEVSTGLVLEVGISGKKINVIEHKVSLNKDGRTCLVN